MQKISFNVIISEEKCDSKSLRRTVAITATIDGRVVGRDSVPLNYFGILATAGLNCNFLPLTCSCGVPGCAGFFEEGYLRWNEDTVTWLLDAKEHANVFDQAPHDAVHPNFLRLTFATSQYGAALESLRAALKAALKDGPLLDSSGYLDDRPIESMEALESNLAESKSWILTRLERDARARIVFGDLANQNIVAGFTDGSQYSAGLQCVLTWVLSEEAANQGITLAEDETAFVEKAVLEVWRPRLTSDSRALDDTLKTFPWEVIRSRFYRSQPPPEGADSNLDLSDAWSRAEMSTISTTPEFAPV